MPLLLWPASVWGGGRVLSSAIAGGILLAQPTAVAPGDLTAVQSFPAALAILPSSPTPQQQQNVPHRYRPHSNLWLAIGNVSDFDGNLLDLTTTTVTFTVADVLTGAVLYTDTVHAIVEPGYYSSGPVDGSMLPADRPILVSARAFYLAAPDVYATVDHLYYPAAPLQLTFARESVNRLQVSFPAGPPDMPTVAVTITDGSGRVLVHAAACTQVDTNLWRYDVPASCAVVGAVWTMAIDYVGGGLGPAMKGRIAAVAVDGG